MASPGWWAAVGCAALLTVIDVVFLIVMSHACRGDRNHVAGIRLPSLRKSDAAWRAGHAAAKRVMTPVLVLAMVIALVSVPMQLVPVAYVVLVGVCLVCTVLSLALGSVAGVRAARRVDADSHSDPFMSVD